MLKNILFCLSKLSTLSKLFMMANFLCISFTANNLLASSGTSALKNIPIQDEGRIKPFDSFARESLMLIYGKQKFNERPAHEVIFTWYLLPKVWSEKKIVQIKNLQLKETLKISKTKNLFSPLELFSNNRLSLVVQELSVKLKNKEKLDPYYQAVQTLQSQLGLFKAISNGFSFRFVPPKNGDKWLDLRSGNLAEFQASESILAKFQELSVLFVKVISRGLPKNNDAKEKNREKDKEGLKLQSDFAKVVTEFKAIALAENVELYPTDRETSIEVHYNSLDPFKWSWILYLLGALALLFAWFSQTQKTQNIAYRLSWVLLGLGFAMHTYGFLLRILIAGRPPVTNMYESVIWVSWGGMLFAMIIEFIQKKRFVLLCGAIGAILCLVVASLAPAIMDPSINPLQPVLVSNFWLLIHVLTITISYSAFLLAFVLGDIGLALSLKGDKYKKHISDMAQGVYRAIQIGVVLLAAGTILGGIWADYSWGRFWGWDPKETWALIALLGYVAILHGKLAGLLKDFGLLAAAVIGFSLVMMAWYGVNFVLGAGLHTYGFGGGGVEYVSSFVGLHFIYVIYCVMRRS